MDSTRRPVDCSFCLSGSRRYSLCSDESLHQSFAGWTSSQQTPYRMRDLPTGQCRHGVVIKKGRGDSTDHRLALISGARPRKQHVALLVTYRESKLRRGVREKASGLSVDRPGDENATSQIPTETAMRGAFRAGKATGWKGPSPSRHSPRLI